MIDKVGLGIEDIIGDKRVDILRLAAQHKASNVRVFGSVARGEARPDSDVDLLVTVSKGVTIFDLVGLWRELQVLLGRKVSLVTDGVPDPRFLHSISADVVAL
jgi:hypothetical protein